GGSVPTSTMARMKQKTTARSSRTVPLPCQASIDQGFPQLLASRISLLTFSVWHWNLGLLPSRR
ncbi:MAG: hypothetical protein JWN02_199, partial [Acidobacteria bacterium]|nr:hypothetical protein [Acidobacteriota bacterium]